MFFCLSNFDYCLDYMSLHLGFDCLNSTEIRSSGRIADYLANNNSKYESR